MDKAAFFILNVFINSLLVFFTAVLLIEAIIFLFRIPQGRMAANLRIIPFLKLPLDLYLYDFSRWSYMYGINPLDSEAGTRTLSFYIGWIHYLPDYFINITYSGIQLLVADDKTFTFADMIGYSLHPLLLKIFSFLFLSITAAIVLRRLFLYYHSFKMLDDLAKGSLPVTRNIDNSPLSGKLKKYGVTLRTSPSLKGSPFVIGWISSIIYIPLSVSQNLSQKEYEAVIAHEVEHVRYKDSWLRLILNFIGALFWWIPSKWYCRIIEEGHEVGCDLKCAKYGIDYNELASALYKSAKYSKHTSIFAHHFTRYKILKRVNRLLSSPTLRFKIIRFTFGCVGLGIGFGVILLGRFWTF